MGRGLKQLLYGLLYLGIMALVVWLIVLPRFQAVATCTDGIQNQSEEEIDCGGECEPCELRGLAIDVGEVETISVGERVTLLVVVTNPSSNFGLEEVLYRFEVLGSLGEILASRSGNISLLPSEQKYIVEAGLNVSRSQMREVQFVLGEANFIDGATLPRYTLEIENVETAFPESEVRVTGILRNENSFNLREVKIATILYTPEGELANAGTTLLSDIGAFSQREFLIAVPRTEMFIDATSTEAVITNITL